MRCLISLFVYHEYSCTQHIYMQMLISINFFSVEELVVVQASQLSPVLYIQMEISHRCSLAYCLGQPRARQLSLVTGVRPVILEPSPSQSNLIYLGDTFLDFRSYFTLQSFTGGRHLLQQLSGNSKSIATR